MEKKNELITQELDEKAMVAFAVEEGQEEHLSQEEMELPFLRIAQKGSPQVDDDAPNYIEGLKAGSFFNTVSSQVYGDELKVQVHGYFRNYTIWKGLKGSGEFQGTMTPDEFDRFEKTNKLERDGGDYVHTVDGESLRYTDTRNFIVSLPEYEEEGILIFPMSSTGIKPAKNWNTLNMGRRVDGKKMKRYMTLWELKTSGFEKNGYTWKQVSRVKPLGWVNNELREFGQSMAEFVNAIKETGVKYSEGTETVEAKDSDF